MLSRRRRANLIVMKQQNDSGGTAPELQLPLHPSEEFRPKLNGWTTDGNRIQTCPEYAWGFIPRSQVLYYLNDEGGNGWKADYSGILPLKWVIGKWCWYIDPDSGHPHAGERFDWGIECWRPRDEGDFDLEKLVSKLKETK